jgi:hypothetical protein
VVQSENGKQSRGVSQNNPDRFEFEISEYWQQGHFRDVQIGVVGLSSIVDLVSHRPSVMQFYVVK